MSGQNFHGKQFDEATLTKLDIGFHHAGRGKPEKSQTNQVRVMNAKSSILKKAFAGELVPQDQADELAAALLARSRAEPAAKANEPKTHPRARQSNVVGTKP